MLVSGISSSYMNKSITEHNKKKKAECVQAASKIGEKLEIDERPDAEVLDFQVDPASKDLSVAM